MVETPSESWAFPPDQAPFTAAQNGFLPRRLAATPWVKARCFASPPSLTPSRLFADCWDATSLSLSVHSSTLLDNLVVAAPKAMFTASVKSDAA